MSWRGKPSPSLPPAPLLLAISAMCALTNRRWSTGDDTWLTACREHTPSTSPSTLAHIDMICKPPGGRSLDGGGSDLRRGTWLVPGGTGGTDPT
jgi:hypothetical protein